MPFNKIATMFDVAFKCLSDDIEMALQRINFMRVSKEITSQEKDFLLQQLNKIEEIQENLLSVLDEIKS